MAMKLLLDTNVLIDYYARRQPFFDDALKLRVAAFFGDVELWAASQSFPDVEYILQEAIPLETLRTMMSDSLSFIKVAVPSADDLAEGLRSGWPDLEDYLVARSAERIRADYLITRDSAGFARATMPVETPSGFLRLLANEHGLVYDDVTL